MNPLRKFLICLLLGRPSLADARDIVMYHWCEGGTGITNFRSSEQSIYQEAIEKHGDKFLVVVPQALGYISDSYMSLHDLHPSRRDLSDFWKVFHEVEADHRRETI